MTSRQRNGTTTATATRRRAWLVLPLTLLLLLVACGDTPSPSPGTAQATIIPSQVVTPFPTYTAGSGPTPTPGTGQATILPQPAATGTGGANTATTGPTVTPTLGPDMFANPVIKTDFPDPDTLRVGDTYYVFATNSGGTNIQAASSTDLVDWHRLGDALPALPGWAQPGDTWAPEVTTWDGGKSYVMYFAAHMKGGARQCIGVATSDEPAGPFASSADQPFICNLEEGGDIDPASFADDDGSRYVLWKNDGNCCDIPTQIYIQKVSADGLTREGDRTALIKKDQTWEGNVIEAPTLWKNGGKYYLFYSANSYAGLDYAVGYAVADSILGPYSKPQNKPILATNLQKLPTAFGPGGQDVVVAPGGQTWLVYHSWQPGGDVRWLNLDKLDFTGGKPVIEGPTLGPQKKP